MTLDAFGGETFFAFESIFIEMKTGFASGTGR
jgi:hypothetical protein